MGELLKRKLDSSVGVLDFGDSLQMGEAVATAAPEENLASCQKAVIGGTGRLKIACDREAACDDASEPAGRTALHKAGPMIVTGNDETFIQFRDNISDNRNWSKPGTGSWPGKVCPTSRGLMRIELRPETSQPL